MGEGFSFKPQLERRQADVSACQSDGREQQHASGELALPLLLPGQRAVEYNRSPMTRENWNLVDIYCQAVPAVVKITADQERLDGQGWSLSTTGTGFFVRQDGTIATDYHVVEKANKLIVQTSDGCQYPAVIEDVDKAHDLALLKIQAGPFARFRVFPLGDANLKPGDGVVALGYPRGWGEMYASPGRYEGIQIFKNVAKPEAIAAGEDPDRIVLESGMHIEPGNSGGPLLSAAGKVVGIIATTDAKVNEENDGLSVPGRLAEATPVQDLLNLLNRTRQIRPLHLMQTAESPSVIYAPRPYWTPPEEAPAPERKPPAGQSPAHLYRTGEFNRSIICEPRPYWTP